MECECDRNHLRPDRLRQPRAWAISIAPVTRERLISATQDAEHGTWKASSFGALEYLSLHPCIGGTAPVFNIELKIEVDFFHELPLWEIRPAITQKLHPEKRRGHPATGWPLL